MIEIYKVIFYNQYIQSKGLSHDDSTKIINCLSKNKKAFVDLMMAEELGITNNDENPIMNALVTFLAFVLFGLVPSIKID